MWGAGRLAAAAFVMAVVVAMAVNPGRPTEPYRAAADEVPIPTAWTMIEESLRDDRGPGGCGILASVCPGVIRRYAVIGEGPIAAPVGDAIRDRLRALGYETTGGWPERCPTRQVGDPCYFALRRGRIHLTVNVLAPAEISTTNGALDGRVSVTLGFASA